MNILDRNVILLLIALFTGMNVFAQQQTNVITRIDARRITVGDQARLFIEVHNNPKQERLQWAQIPDTFNSLEVVEKGKIDTLVQNGMTTYKQRLLITGFDSGMYTIPSFQFAVIPNSGNPYTVQTDSFPLLVQTVPVDTTKAFRGIKGIIVVKSTWRDYIWYIVGGIVFLLLIGFVIYYFVKNKKVELIPSKPKETSQEKALRLLSELDQQQLWQHDKIKDYYVELTDILRSYIEERFRTPAMELTTDELLHSALMNKEMQPYRELLSKILYTADLAKFAKAQPTPVEHVDTMENAKQFVNNTKPVEQEPTKEKTTPKQS